MRRRRSTHQPARQWREATIEVVLLTEDVAVIRRDGLTVPQGFTTRAQLPARLSELIAAVGTATRVTVREPDGAQHTDVLTPPHPHPPSLCTSRVASAPDMQGGGFTPGEEVQLFQLVGTTYADANGHADSGAHAGVELLFGAISGTTLRHPERI